MAEGTVTTRPQARSFIIKRPRLTRLLDESEARILLLVAPAGYGKTTLAREWLEGKTGVAWYSGGPSMGDVAALAAGIAEALAPTEEELVERIRSLAARSQSPDVLARAIAASDAAKHCAFLAIDDCHHAAGSDPANAFLNELIFRTELRVVGTSRVRPAWVTPRMLVYGEAAMLEMEDLAFTNEETEEVLALSALPSEIVAEARGWPAVVGLVASRDGVGAPARGLEPTDLYEFFAGDLFGATSPETRRGLFLLALGADATGDVAREVLGADHDSLLAEAVRVGFLASTGGSIALHPLLRGFLVSKFRTTANSEVDSSVKAVTTALAARGRWDECLATLGEFPRPELIASILDQALVELLAAGRATTIKRWIALASDNGVEDPILLLAQAEVALRDGETRSAQVLGERAGQLIATGDAAARAFVVAGRAAHLSDSRIAARANCAKAEALAESLETKAESLWIQFISAVEDELSEAVAISERLGRVPDPRADHALRVHNARALMLFDLDRTPRAAANEFDLSSGLLPQVRDPVLRTNFLNMHAHVMVVVGNYDAAILLADQQISEAGLSGVEFAVDHGRLSKAGALIGLRRFRDAQHVIAQLERSPSAESDYILRNTNLMAARLRIAMGDLERAEILLRRRTGTSPIPWPEQTAYHGLVLGALGWTHESERSLSDAQTYARHVDAMAIAQVGRAILHVRSRRLEEARSALADAIDRGCVDAAVTGCRAFPDLGGAAAQDPGLAQTLTAVFARSRDVDLARRIGLELPRELRRRDALTSRESDVYDLLVQGRTNQEISQTLFISNSTTKVHVRHIFEKLGVHSRAEAAGTTPD